MTSKHPNRTLRDFYNAAETDQEGRGKLNVSKSDGENHSNIDNDKGKGKPTAEETKKQLVISQREEMKKKKKETLPSAYHFPASLAKGAPPTPSSTNQSSNLLQNSESQSVDLDLSFDYVSKLEQKNRKKDDGNEEKVLSNNTSSSNSTKIIQLPPTKATKMISVDLPSPNLNLNLQEEKMSISISPPSPQPPRGMSSASWSARKGPPAPLSLAFKRKSNQQQKIPQQPSVFSPDTVVGENEDSDVDLDLPQDEEDQPLPITPLSATKRSVDAQSSISMKTKDDLPFGTDPKTGMELPLSPSMQKVMVNSTPLPFVELPSSLLELQNANGIRSPPSEPLPPIPLPNLNPESSTSSKASRMMSFRPSFPPEAVYPLSGAANSLGLSFDDPTQSNSKVSLDENIKPLSLSAIEMNSRNRSNSSRSRNQNQNRSQSISSKRSKRPGTGNSNVSGKSFQTANTRPSTDVDGGEKRDSFESFKTADDEEGEGELEEMNSMIQDDEEEVKEEKKIKNKVDSNFTIRPRFSNQSSRPSLGAMSSNLSENASSNPSIYSLNRHPLSSNGHNSNGAASPSNSHSSPRTPFSPLFSDPGTARSNWTMATSAVPTPGIQIVKLPEVPMVRGGSAPGGRIDRSSIQEPKQVEKIKNEADRSIGLPRSETEEWIKSQTVAQNQDENGNDNNERKREISTETSTSCYSSEQSSHYDGGDADDLEVESQLIGDEPKADQQIPKRKRRPTLIVSTEDQGDESEFDVLRKSLDQSKGKNHVQSPLLLSPATSQFNEKDLKTSPRTEPLTTKLDKRVLVRRALTDVSRINPSVQERKSSSPGIGLGLEFGNSSPDSSFDLGLGPRSSLELPTSNSLRRFHSDNSMRRNYQKGDHFKVDMSNSDSNQKKENDEEALQLSDGFGGFQNALGLSSNGGETVQRKASFSKNLPDPPMTAPILNGWRKPEDQINPNGNGKKKSVEASPSFSSSLEGFACHVTPPVPAASNLANSVQIQRASINNNFSSIPLANGSNPNEISLLPIENRPASAWDALANSRWSSKFWSVASSAGLTSVLSSRRNSELNGSSKATMKDGILVSNNKSPVAGQMKTLNLVDRRKNNETMREGTVSAPASSVLSSRSTFESSNFNHQKDSTSNGSPITTNTDSVTSRKQRRNSRIHYISNGNEIRLDMREREKSVDPLLDALKSPRVRDSPTGQTPDIHFGVPISKSRWTMLPGDESKDQVERVLGGDETLEVERNIRRHSSILPMGESSNGLPLWLRGEKFESKSSIWNETGEEIQDDGGLQASRDKLRLLASQTMPGATLPHQYLEIQGARKRVATTRPSHRPTSSTSAIPTATIVPFGWTSVKNKRDSKMHVGTLIKDSNGVPLTTRFAKGTKRSTTELTTLEGDNQMNHSESNGELEMPTTSGRPMSIFVPTSSIQAHLLRNSGLNLGSKNQRFSILNQFTPKNVLESSKPSKTLFFAGCLGMPWLWLIGGWWLGEDGLIITTGLDRVEMWKHEASMRDRIEDEDSLQDQDSEESSHGTLVDRKERSSSLPPPIISNHSDLKRESFRRESSAPPEISIPGRSLAKVRSHSTIRSFSSSNNTNSIQFNLNVSQSSEKIPKKRTESIASILAFKPEVNFFQSPIRPIPEGFDSNNLALEDHAGKASPRIDNDNPTFEGVETVTGFKNRPNSLTSLHSRRKSKSTINMNVEDQDVQPKSTFEDDEDTSFRKESKDRNSIIFSNDDQIKNKSKNQSSSSLERFSNYLVYLNRLDRFVLYNRIAALISSLMVFSAFGVALFYVVANF